MRLHRLLPAARLRLQPDFFAGASAPDLGEFVKPFERGVSLTPLAGVIRDLLEREGPTLAPSTDAWLAPRLHAAVRLTRREAADRDIWAYLAVIEFPEYVRARWGAEPGRWFASEVNQALSRLWWGAEMCRDGADYGPVTTAFSVQDVPNTWFRLDAFHNRALAVGLSRLMQRRKPTGRQLNALATATNLSLTTTVLDAFARTTTEAPGALPEWLELHSSTDELVGASLPTGPNDCQIDAEVLDQVVMYLDGLLAPDDDAA